MELLELLFESSTLRPDLRDKIEKIIKDIIGKIELTDELLARVEDETYEFIKELKK
jgi:argonaute-like protein implicated in RNA metabolism and viral defense